MTRSTRSQSPSLAGTKSRTAPLQILLLPKAGALLSLPAMAFPSPSSTLSNPIFSKRGLRIRSARSREAAVYVLAEQVAGKSVAGDSMGRSTGMEVALTRTTPMWCHTLIVMQTSRVAVQPAPLGVLVASMCEDL